MKASTFIQPKAMRYLFVGGLAYLFEMTALYILRYYFDFSNVVSVAVSFWIGFVMAFTLQKFVTFQNHEKQAHHIRRQLVLYSALVAWNFAFTLVCAKLLSSYAPVMVIRTASIIVITSWNYYFYHIIFAEKLEL